MLSAKKQSRLRRKSRIRARVKGDALKPRLSVYRSNTHIFAQMIDDTAGKTLAAASSLSEKKGTKTEKAQLVGKTIAEKSKAKGIEKCVFDRNGFQYHGRVKAVAESAREGGLKF